MALTIYHNPRCSKSRQTLALLEEKGLAPNVVSYLENPPTKATLKEIVSKLGVSSVRDIMRKKEAPYTDLSLAEASEAALLDAVSAHPILLERPIVVYGDRAAIGRPPESVLEIL